MHLRSAMESLENDKIDYTALGIEAQVVLSLNLLKGGGTEKCTDPAGQQHLLASTTKNYQHLLHPLDIFIADFSNRI